MHNTPTTPLVNHQAETVTVKSSVGDIASGALCCFGWTLLASGNAASMPYAGAAIMAGVGANCGDKHSTVRVTVGNRRNGMS